MFSDLSFLKFTQNWEKTSHGICKLIMYRVSSVIRRGIFLKKKNAKNLDLSIKTDLHLWNSFRKGKTCIVVKFHRTD